MTEMSDNLTEEFDEEFEFSPTPEEGTPYFEDSMEQDFGQDDLFREIIEKKEKKFQTMTVDDLIEEKKKKIHELCETFGIPFSVCGALLRAYKWKSEQLTLDYFDEPKKVLKLSGIDLDHVNSNVLVGTEDEMECPCCYDDFEGTSMYALSCKHFSCKSCWKSFNEVGINDGPQCLTLKCPFPKCKLLVTESMIKKTVDKNLYEKYTKYLLRSFIDDDPNIKWCTNPKCGKVIFTTNSKSTNVLCSCGNCFCFQCNAIGHAPLSCKNFTSWEVKRKNDSATAHFIVKNTKACPKCFKSIEKNGGCNYIGCVCGHGFCWNCLGPHDHNMSAHVCQKYEESESKEHERNMLEKYMFYFTRYKTHEQSEELEEKLRKSTEQKRTELMQKQEGSYLELDYLINAMEQLFECRKILKFTYPYSYYLTGKNEKDLFDYLQQELETNTEELSYLLENNATAKQKIINSAKVAKTRLEHLLDGVSKNN